MNQPAIHVSNHQQAARRYIESLPAADGHWLTEQRQAATRRFTELGFPNARLEAWRYTDVEGLLEQGFVTLDQTDDFSSAAVMQLFLAEPVAGRLVFVDGVFQPALSDTDIPGVRVQSLFAAMAAGDAPALQALGSVSGTGDNAFSALNMATMQDGAVIRVLSGTRVEKPIELLNIATKAASGRNLRSRHLILMEKDSDVSLVERYLSLEGDRYFNNLVVEIVMDERAHLHHQRVQQESLQAYHLSDIYIALQAQAHYQGVSAALGAAWSRTVINTRFAAPGASCELDGLYLVGDRQLVDFHLDVEHGVPACDSREHFKGILCGSGRAVFDGHILVQKQAQKSNAHLTNANLMLSRRAEIDTKPQLEIFADDVQCSHGTTVGQLDDQALFYLRSRGLNEDQARRLLCLGFAEEILARFQADSLRGQLAEVIRQRVAASGGEWVEPDSVSV